ncbi:MAG: TatD family hydrolase [bacterium]|nr:TatD family hydrolase [bacterium]
MNIFDTHSHYNLEPLAQDWQNLALQAQAAGVKQSVIIGTNIASSLVAANMREKMKDFFLATVGIHPEEVKKTKSELAALARLDLEQFIAYGEIGLDFYRCDRQAANFATLVAAQIHLLQEQLKIALAKPKPVIFHVRDDFVNADKDDNAYGLILKIVAQSGVVELPLIFHCFSGDANYLQKILQLPNSYISFAGNLTFKNARNLQALANLVPPERLLLETDAPFLAPEPKRGGTCQPAFIAHTAQFAAQHLSVSIEQIYANSCRVFNQS